MLNPIAVSRRAVSLLRAETRRARRDVKARFDMPKRIVSGTMSNVQWAGHLLDELVAPEFAGFLPGDIPDVPNLPNYFRSFFVNNALLARFDGKARPLIVTMLRRLHQATSDYRDARKILTQFRSTLKHSNAAMTLYLRALSHMEEAIIHGDLAVTLNHAVARCADSSLPKDHFTYGDDTPEERVRFLHNGLKHFDKSIMSGKVPDHVAPLWLVSDGVRGIFEAKGAEPAVVRALRFDELANMLKELAENGRWLSEEVYKLALERRENKRE